MKFRSAFSKKSKIIFSVVALIIIASTLPVFFDANMTGNWQAKLIVLTINILSLALLCWIISKTFYEIKNDSLLICKSGPFKKKIQIKNIKRIEFHNGLIIPSLWKLSLSDKGIIIFYNQFDEIYISPKNKEKFLTEILKINPTILLPINA